MISLAGRSKNADNDKYLSSQLSSGICCHHLLDGSVSSSSGSFAAVGSSRVFVSDLALRSVCECSCEYVDVICDCNG